VGKSIKEMNKLADNVFAAPGCRQFYGKWQFGNKDHEMCDLFRQGLLRSAKKTEVGGLQQGSSLLMVAG
jgi:hypothetical protein